MDTAAGVAQAATENVVDAGRRAGKDKAMETYLPAEINRARNMARAAEASIETRLKVGAMEDHPLAATFAEQAVADTRISLRYLKDVCPDICQADSDKPCKDLSNEQQGNESSVTHSEEPDDSPSEENSKLAKIKSAAAAIGKGAASKTKGLFHHLGNGLARSEGQYEQTLHEGTDDLRLQRQTLLSDTAQHMDTYQTALHETQLIRPISPDSREQLQTPSAVPFGTNLPIRSTGLHMQSPGKVGHCSGPQTAGITASPKASAGNGPRSGTRQQGNSSASASTSTSTWQTGLYDYQIAAYSSRIPAKPEEKAFRFDFD